MTTREVRVEAHAKINVFLRVLGNRADSYHDIETLILPITLADVLTFRRGQAGVRISVKHAAGVPQGEANLIHVAASALAERTGAVRASVIDLVKRIPVAAGLGGGSADAAATLLGLNEQWGCGLSLEELMEIGARLGSDVPALLHKGPVVARGRGEVLEPTQLARTWWVLRPQDFPVSTRDVYSWWDDEGSTGPDPGRLLRAARAGRVDELAALPFNDLEPMVARRHPRVAEAKQELLEAGAVGAVMSGSGPTMAGLARDENHARKIAKAIPGSILVCGPP